MPWIEESLAQLPRKHRCVPLALRSVIIVTGLSEYPKQQISTALPMRHLVLFIVCKYGRRDWC
jgi:hypothetical protein